MEYIFTKNKDGHSTGEVISIMLGDWREWYWRKKKVIEPYSREEEIDLDRQEPETETPERKAPEKKRRKRKK